MKNTTTKKKIQAQTHKKHTKKHKQYKKQTKMQKT